MAKQIKIRRINGGSDGFQLINLYFQETAPHKFNLFDLGEQIIKTQPPQLTSGKDFSFEYSSVDWQITGFAISEINGMASGNWQVKHPRVSIRDDDPESGTFQAQAGGSVPGEDEASASATA